MCKRAEDAEAFKQTESRLLLFLLRVDCAVNVWPLADSFSCRVRFYSDHKSASWSLIQMFLHE